jgi:hypothetical protein
MCGTRYAAVSNARLRHETRYRIISRNSGTKKQGDTNLPPCFLVKL